MGFSRQEYWSGVPFPGGTSGKNLPANVGDVRDTSSIPGLGRSPGGGHGNPLQYSCLENPMDRGAWWATTNTSSLDGERTVIMDKLVNMTDILPL